ncbi:MAG: FKBP-type peptidyl-prolyl cis-trans isomerase [Muribaculaceae bacterium]|nr:FKBP-type peptidyl-prolyl cis-trans isomerase [Muribaculaceae bacterium]
MNKFPILLLIIALACGSAACNKDDDDSVSNLYSRYEEWREENDMWLEQQLVRTNPDGTPYFEKVVPSWNPAAYVLIHYFNDRSETAGNISPLSTSTIDTRYYLTYYNGTPIDSSYLQTKNGAGIFRCKLNEVIEGWTMAFETMHVGDTAELVIPYQSGYGVSTSSGILPYSNMKYNVRLVGVPYYEREP